MVNVTISAASPTYDVRAYGADPTGTADSTAAIAAAIAATPVGNTVFFSPGVYLVHGNALTVSKAITVDLGSGILRATTAGTVLAVTGLIGAHLAQPAVVNGTVDCNSVASNGVLFTYCDDALASNVTVLNGVAASGAGVQFLTCLRPRAMGVSATATGSGVILSASPYGTVIGGTHTSMQRDGVLVYSGSHGSTVSGVAVNGYNTAAAAGRGGIHAYGSDGVAVSGCTVDSGVVGGYTSSPKIRFRDARDFTCSGNFCTGALGGGIVVLNFDDIGDGAGSGTIVGNTIKGVQTQGIDVTSGGGAATNLYPVAITGNRIDGVAGGYGIAVNRYAAGSPSFVISGNHVENTDNEGITVAATASITGNTVRNPGKGGSGSQDGIQVWQGSGTTVVGNLCFDDQVVHTMTYGLRVAGGSARAIGNLYSGWTTAAVGNAGNAIDILVGEISTAKVGFYGTAPVVKPTVSGSRGANAALASLLTALAGQGLLTDSSS